MNASDVDDNLELVSAVGERPVPWNVKFIPYDVDTILYMEGMTALRNLMRDGTILGPKGWRRALAHHTSTACQPQKQRGPADNNLKDCGIENAYKRVNMWEVSVKLPHSYYAGDCIEIEAVGSKKSKKEAMEECVQKLMCLLLAIAPQKVHLHPSCFTYGTESIRRLREAAATAREELFKWDNQAINGAHFTLIEIDENYPAPRWQPLARSRNRLIHDSALPYEPTFSPAEQEERNFQIMETLVNLIGKRGIFYPYVCPPQQIDELSRMVPRGGLKPFVKARPHMFEIVNEDSTQWGVQFPGAVHFPGSAVGGSSSTGAHGSVSALLSAPAPRRGRRRGSESAVGGGPGQVETATNFPTSAGGSEPTSSMPTRPVPGGPAVASPPFIVLEDTTNAGGSGSEPAIGGNFEEAVENEGWQGWQRHWWYGWEWQHGWRSE